jgi:hypothetical protein
MRTWVVDLLHQLNEVGLIPDAVEGLSAIAVLMHGSEVLERHSARPPCLVLQVADAVTR